MKALKWMLWIGGGLVVLLIVAVAIVAATFDPNQYKPQIVDLVKEKTGRTLTMDGKIGLTFFPRIGAEVEKVALSEPKSTRTFARIDEARVALALLPLLRKQVIVDQVTLSGLAVDLVRYKDGRTNFDDLLGEKKPGEAGAEGGSAGRDAVRDRHRRHLAPQRKRRLARRVGRHRRAAFEREPQDRPHRERACPGSSSWRRRSRVDSRSWRCR